MSKVYIRSIFNHFRPCLLCGGPTENALCRHCLCRCSDSASSVAGAACTTALCRCGLPLPGAEPQAAHSLCGRCLGSPPPWQWLAPMAAYAGPVPTLLNRFKHRHCHAAERALQQLARLHWQGLPMTVPDDTLLVPVPLHWRRQWLRGFNQAMRLACFFSQLCGLAPAPVLRRRAGGPLQHASRQRRRQVNHGFTCTTDLGGRAVVLVDDVVTTGETAIGACHALQNAGAHVSGVLCMARTLPH